ncbi:MAG TPA: hypothetical protein VGG74_18785 [Kofleriaceae bacterium]|jgi:predicted lysophospholipase L1 biosynthesis ABC-type transport system permease subunit
MTARLFAHGIATFVALGALASAIGGMIAGIPAALSVFCLIIGIVLCALIPLSLRGSRAAWSVIISIMVVEAVGTFFGAATLARALHINLMFALLLPLVLAGGVGALVSLRESYRDN